MSKKKKPINKQIEKLFDEIPYEEPKTEPRKEHVDLSSGQGELEPSEISAETPEIELSEPEPQVSDAPDLTENEVEPDQRDASDGESEVEVSAEDLLEDVRQTLITESSVKEEAEQSKWWKRIGKGRRRKKAEDVQPPPSVVMPVESIASDAVEQGGVRDEGEYVEQLDELIDMLGNEAREPVVAEEPSVQVDISTPEEELPREEHIDVKELKKRAFHARTTPEEEERSLSEVRSVALDEGEDVFVEVEAKAADPMQDRIKAVENALIPYRRYFNFIFVFVSIVMVILVSVSLYRVYVRSLPPPAVEEVALLPYPVGMNLPGGLSFNLKKGSLQEGRWNPRGPEWLEGTEICRWVAIPHSRQLEAVVRTLTREDQIELIMSNNDKLTYTVNSINQLTLEEMQEIDSGSPCMMLVLAQADTEKRWVVTAIP